MTELATIVGTEQNPNQYKELFPEWSEVVVPIGENPDGNIRVIRAGNTLRIRLQNSLILTSLNFELSLNNPWYLAWPFNESFSYEDSNQDTWVNIEIFPEIFTPRNTDDVLSIYLATVFSSFIGTGERMEMNSLAIAMALRTTWIYNGGRIKRYMEICWLYGKWFREFRRTQWGVLVNSQRVRDALVAQPVNTEKGWLIGVAQPLSNWIDRIAKVVQLDTPSNAIQVVTHWATIVERIVSPRVNPSVAIPSDHWIDSFINSIADKSPTRAIKLLEKAISENRFGEAWTTRLKSILQTRTGLNDWNSNDTSIQTPNPGEFIEWLSWSLRDQIGQLEKQLKRWKRYGQAYMTHLQKHKELLEGRLAWR